MKANIFGKITERDLLVSRLQAPPGMRNGLTSPTRNLVLVVMMVSTSEKIGDIARNFNRNKVMNMIKSLVAVAIMVNTHERIARKAKPDIKSQ